MSESDEKAIDMSKKKIDKTVVKGVLVTGSLFVAGSVLVAGGLEVLVYVLGFLNISKAALFTGAVISAVFLTCISVYSSLVAHLDMLFNYVYLGLDSVTKTGLATMDKLDKVEVAVKESSGFGLIGKNNLPN